VKRHRGFVLLALILFSVAWLGFSLAMNAGYAAGSLSVLLLLVLLSAVAGIAFSWRRYRR
jgi:hypothetical protein